MPKPDTPDPMPRFSHTEPVLGRLGSLETRLLRNEEELAEVQRLRYRVFFEDDSAPARCEDNLHHRDEDRFDPHCDHLLVLNCTEIVGTYRLLTEENAAASCGFYSQAEFDLNPLLNANKDLKFLELGRSCISPDYRSKRTLELLWHGTWSYALQKHRDILFGCASFPGTDPGQFSDALSWLAENACISSVENCPANTSDKVTLGQFKKPGLTPKKMLHEMPPMLKGYLRLGAKVCSEAVIDHQFGTTDVLVVLKVADINPRYIAHFRPDASRYSA